VVANCLLGVAGDGGARETVSALADGEHCVMADIGAPLATEPSDWVSLLTDPRYVGLAVGTSDSPEGKAVESHARRAAAQWGKPVFAIEDYPANYWPMDDAPTRCLTVESELVADWQRQRLGPRCPALMVWPAPRYDLLRKRRETLRESVRRGSDSVALNAIWAGQPETEDNLTGLAALMPALRSHRVRLLFRAHPRDSGYPHRYAAVLGAAGLIAEDVSRNRLDDVLRRGPKVVITQFSAVAIEAGFYGIPALHVLFPDTGAARLRQKKGYAEPFVVRAGAAAIVSKPSDVERVLGELLYDNGRRANIISRFDAYFCRHPGNARDLVRIWLEQARTPDGVAGGH
jgi:hypothetical protein